MSSRPPPTEYHTALLLGWGATLVRFRPLGMHRTTVALEIYTPLRTTFFGLIVSITEGVQIPSEASMEASERHLPTAALLVAGASLVLEVIGSEFCPRLCYCVVVRCSSGSSVAQVCAINSSKHRHYSGNRHCSYHGRCWFSNLPSRFTGTVAGNRHRRGIKSVGV